MHAPTQSKPKPTFLPHPLFNSCASPVCHRSAVGGTEEASRQGGAEGASTRVPRVAPPKADNPCAESSIGLQHHEPSPILPRTCGGGAEQSEAEGASFASPAIRKSAEGGAGEVSAKGGRRGTPLPLEPLIDDLLNPSITTAELCQLHNLTLEQLDDLLASPRFKRAHTRFVRINANRRQLLEDEAQTLALTRLTDLLRDRPETPTHAETLRKAATTLLRVPPVAPPKADNPCAEPSIAAQHHDPSPILPRVSQIRRRRAGGGAEQSEAEGASFSSPARAGEVPRPGGAEGAPPDAQSPIPDPQSPPASTTPSPSNPPTQPVPTKPGTIKDTHNEGVSNMNTKAAAAIFTIAVGSGVIAAAWYMSNDTQPQPRTPTPNPQPTQPESSGLDLFSLPSTPSPAKVFFESASGTPIPAGSRNDVRGMIGMMASLIDRMDEFDVDGDGLLSDLEKLAMGMQLRKEFLAEHDLDGDGNMSGDEWRAFQKAMFEKSAQGQKLMAQFDLDGDGLLSEEEQAAFDEHLRQQEEQRKAEDRARMDKDNDGQISDDERRAAQRLERDFWRNQMRTAESSFDYDGDGELNIEETGDAWEAWIEYQELDDFITRYDTDGDRNMGPTDYDAFLTDYERRSPDADINNDGKVNVADINAFRDLVIRSRGI